MPVLRFLEQDSDATAIFIYPTKVNNPLRHALAELTLTFVQALAQDQKTALEQLLWSCSGLQHIKVATYDGDTPQEQRPGTTRAFQTTHFLLSHTKKLQAFAKLHLSYLLIST